MVVCLAALRVGDTHHVNAPGFEEGLDGFFRSHRQVAESYPGE